MQLRIIIAAVAAGLAFVGAGSAQDAANSFVVTNVRVFDGETVTARANVVVQGGRIAAVGPSVRAPAGLPVVDGTGKTLIPGLIDAHTHTFGAAQKDALRFGVTTELDMFAHPSVLPGMRAQRDGLGRVDQSDLYSAGVLATAPRGHGTEYGFPIPTLTTPAEAEAWVKARVAEGSDYIKIVYDPAAGRRPSIDAATLEAVVKAAHGAGKMAVVHVSTADGSLTALRAGADGLAHAFYDAAAPAEFYRLAAERKAFVIPTLGVTAGVAGGDDGRRLAADPQVAPYLSAEQKSSLAATIRAPGVTYTVSAQEVAALKAAKVDVLAGTDSGNPTIAHGASLHAEMSLLVAAGLTPVEALRAATSTPARRFSLKDRGRIVAGARADLVLVEGDPTTDIARTRAIARIWKNGFAVDRTPPAAAPAAPAGTPLSGALGDFETGLQGPPGSTWQPTTDRLAGGSSDAVVRRTEPGAGGSKGALKVEGEVKPAPFSWAGAQLVFGAFGGPGRDISAAKELVFRIRGERPQAVVMFFDTSGPQPKVRPIAVSHDWQEVRVPLAALTGANLKAAVGFAVTTDTRVGPFAFELDDVRLE